MLQHGNSSPTGEKKSYI